MQATKFALSDNMDRIIHIIIPFTTENFFLVVQNFKGQNSSEQNF